MSAIRSFAAGMLLIAILCASSACAETARITFILVNDIYLMADHISRSITSMGYGCFGRFRLALTISYPP
jgi:hypothetical protein